MRYFIPLKAFSSGLVVSVASASPSPEQPACAASVCCDGFTAFDWRSGLACAKASSGKQGNEVTVKTNRVDEQRDSCEGCLEPTMFKVFSGEEIGNLHMVILQRLAGKGSASFSAGEKQVPRTKLPRCGMAQFKCSTVS